MPAELPRLATPSMPSPPGNDGTDMAPRSESLFSWRPPAFVQGDFVAAVQVSAGGWAVVQPAAEAFPNAWQRRLLLWFLVAAAVVLPLGWWFARRLVRPIAGFAAAAEQLGRDPSAPVLALEGPAEVGRAARAFNRTQDRLRSFVEDRTAMIGAISHDLRTPLTRMRFRIEDLDEGATRTGMQRDIDEMEQMISSVLTFLRDAAEPRARETMDLASLVEDVVEDAAFVGQPVQLRASVPAHVDIDAMALRRVLANLVENAVKYGQRAELRLYTAQGDAVTEVRDHGPGLPDTQLERVFQPFYRAPGNQTDRPGHGLGLAVCRSIARAHGGEVRLRNVQGGLVAELRLPLAAMPAG
jgi:signal transduction histidine kinase